MSNIFATGEIAKGKKFIGREEDIKKYKKEYFENGHFPRYSLSGLTRIGKTSLVKNLFENRNLPLPDDIIYIYEDLKKCKSYNELWKYICDQIKDRLTELGLIDDLPERLKSNLELIIEKDDIQWYKFRTTVQKIFKQLASSGKIKKVIIVLDEFDQAPVLFGSEDCHWEVFRELFQDDDLKVSAMTISRKSLRTIETQCRGENNGSTIHTSLDPVQYRGFDDEDIEKYFQVFENMNIKLDKKQIEEIKYYCGNIPYLLSIMGKNIVDVFEDNGNIDITDIFKNKCVAINSYYQDCIDFFKKEDRLKKIIPFVLGPKIGVTAMDKGELIDRGYLREDNGEFVAISKYFKNFLSLTELKISIWENIINLEKKIKQIIHNEFLNIIDKLQVGGNNINEIQKNILEKVGIERNDIIRYEAYIRNNLKIYNQKSSFLDVISLTDSFKIVKYCWTSIFSKYFDNKTYDKLENQFDKCAEARNPVAHGHEEYLTKLDQQEIDVSCKQIFELLAKAQYPPSPSEKEVIDSARKYNVKTNNIPLVNKSVPQICNNLPNSNQVISEVKSVKNDNLAVADSLLVNKNVIKNVELSTKSIGSDVKDSKKNNLVASNKTLDKNVPQIYDLSTKEVEFEAKEIKNNNSLVGFVILKYSRHNKFTKKEEEKECKCKATIKKNTLKNIGIDDLNDLLGKKLKVEIDEINQEGDRYLCKYKSMM